MGLSNLDKDIISWNNAWPLDRWYRQKYNISFNSPQHQEINQIDIFFEWREEMLFKKHENDLKKRSENEKLYKEGAWLTNVVDNSIDEDSSIDWFDKIDITTINSQEENPEE